MRQIMKKWADLKCDGKRRIVALRGPDGAAIRKKSLGPVEKMVQDILKMSPRGGEVLLARGCAGASVLASCLSDGESDPDATPGERLSRLHSRSSASYLDVTDGAYGLGADASPLSSLDKDGELRRR